ncbi:MAG TPA: iron-regulated protein [Porphyromonadaceae bacterium]|nr:iron-regulated protein [Porphyromonadaceae bacterium]HBL33289.1 iron-regulated protein [Porphyromonadaceae bacterium]HBX21323.1 iron-regulated protein [Porphyromonadaceae bacterium]HCM21991.1 iron-regulated protein [Porphyromonadaceae bacterium]
MNSYPQDDKPAYRLYDEQGRSVEYRQMISALSEADIVLVGEYHNNPISHWMEYEITKSLYHIKDKRIILGAEMFEADMQLMLDEYLADIVSSDRFEADARLWSNYSTDYEPLVDFAKEMKVPFIATNIPRRYADLLHRTGNADTLRLLSDEAKQYIAPLPIPFKPDSIMLAEGQMMPMMSKNPLALAKAQSVKDATMAHFIYTNFHKEKVFIHFNGSYHSDHKDGIVYFLRILDPKLKIATVSTAQQEDISILDDAYKGIADFIICVPEAMTKTY